MSYQFNIRLALSFVVFAFVSNVYAECGGAQNLPSEQTHIAFNVNGEKISHSERKQLGDWVSEMNSKYAVQKWITVVGSASESEANSNALAMNRAVAVAREALEDGLVNAPLQIRTQVYPVRNSNNASAEAREVTVELSPGCPNNCCDGQ